FAGSLLKRTLSESMASGTCNAGADAAELYGRDSRDRMAPRSLALAARSLSLELARHRHRLAAHLKRKVKESIPEDVLENTAASCDIDDRDSNDNEKSFNSSTETNSTQLSNPAVRKKKLNWVFNMIVETIEETVECEPVTIKIKTPKVRCGICCLSFNLKSV
ncbi:jg2509, partial [Pararge aegeria aegeria]